MFETLVANILNRYLGAYVEGLNKEQLSVAVWAGIDMLMYTISYIPYSMYNIICT